MAEPHTSDFSARRDRTGLLGLAAAVAVILAAMAVLGILIATGSDGLRTIHSTLGYVAIVVSAIACVSAYRYGRATSRMGIFYHALSLPVLMLVQVALGEMGLETLHMTLGVLILVDAIALVTLAGRSPRTAA